MLEMRNMLSIENQKTENEKMKNLRKIGKIEAGVLGIIVVMTGLVSAGTLSRGMTAGLEIQQNQIFEWIQEDVYVIEDVNGFSTSLLFDENDVPHIFFITENNKLMHSEKSNLGWIDEILDTGVKGKSVSAKLDTNGIFHISYGKENLMYLKSSLNGWQNPVVVDSEVEVTSEFYVSMDLDSNNKPHISYYDPVNKDLKYACKEELSTFTMKTTSNWDIIIVDSDGKVGNYNTIVVDSLNRVHIAYNDHTKFDIKYAIKTGEGFELEIIEKNRYFGASPSITVDENDLPFIAHCGFSGLKLTYKVNSDDWRSEIIDPDQTQCFDPSIVIDENQDIHIGFSKCMRDGINIKFNLMYTKKIAGQWNIETVIDGEPFQFLAFGISLDLDSNNIPRMSYVDYIMDNTLESVYRTA